ncbi:uncharacterized protein LOC110623134 [Manihot esculenta]|uniref:Uncharacterized protein n=1 Tax=Manihot esculenta TaxID=3983 RepID=A0ACB7HBI6_MANES|nr:uncharacterized protein LOC110623134 [Manihot esculenta]KAG8648251.1 hypothetical protein MANES_09G165300v8 [Manihot esculenta]
MLDTFLFKSESLFSKSSLLFSRSRRTTITYPQYVNFLSQCHLFHSSCLLSYQTQIQKPIVCARKKKRGSRPRKFMKVLPALVSFVASNFKILPGPLDLVVAEIGGGDGGGLGIWKVLGNGGSGGWRRKGKTNLGILGALVVCGLGLLFGKELKNDLLSGVFELVLLVTFFIKGHRRQVKYWVLGLCFIGVLMGLRLRREDTQQWVQKIRVCLPASGLLMTKRRNGRRVA